MSQSYKTANFKVNNKVQSRNTFARLYTLKLGDSQI